MQNALSPLSGVEYDEQWRKLDDFITYNPGARHRREGIFKLLKKLSPKTVLDVGCGNGELLRDLKNILPSHIVYSGVDLSPEAVNKNSISMPEVSFNVLDIEKESLNKTFDLIVCSEVIEHLGDRSLAFKNLSAMMSPQGGYLLVTAPTGKIYETEKLWGHTTHPTPAEIRAHAINNNLEVLSLASWGFPFYTCTKYATNINPDWSVKNFGSGSYTKSQKAISNFLYIVNKFNLKNSNFGCQLFALLRKP
jgi:ubiquinone/menaquinone biosynthesis C-methylase UbiE